MALRSESPLAAAVFQQPRRARYRADVEYLSAVPELIVDVGRTHTRVCRVADPLGGRIFRTPDEVRFAMCRNVHAGAVSAFTHRIIVDCMHSAGRNILVCVNDGDHNWGQRLAAGLQRVSPRVDTICTQSCALAAAGATSGIVVDIGWGEARVVPVLHGYMLPSSIRSATDLSARSVLERLKGKGQEPQTHAAEELEAAVRNGASGVDDALDMLFNGTESAGEGRTLQSLVLASLASISVAGRKEVSQCVLLTGGLSSAPQLRGRFARALLGTFDLLDSEAEREARRDRAADRGRKAHAAKDIARRAEGTDQAEATAAAAARAEDERAQAAAVAELLTPLEMARAVLSCEPLENVADPVAADDAGIDYWGVANSLTELFPGVFLSGASSGDGPHDMHRFGAVVKCGGDEHLPEHRVRPGALVPAWRDGAEFGDAAGCIDAVLEAVNKAQERGEHVLFHCSSGQDRSPIVAAMYLIKAAGVSCEKALSFITTKRRVLRLCCVQELREWAASFERRGGRSVPVPPDMHELLPVRMLRGQMRLSDAKFPREVLPLVGAAALCSAALEPQPQKP